MSDERQYSVSTGRTATASGRADRERVLTRTGFTDWLRLNRPNYQTKDCGWYVGGSAGMPSPPSRSFQPSKSTPVENGSIVQVRAMPDESSP